MRPDHKANGGPPRWVKVFGAVALVLVLTAVAVHLAGGGMGHLGHASTAPVDHNLYTPPS
jgi:hypothetical protein